MFNELIYKLKSDEKLWDKYKEYFETRKIAPRTILLKEGEIAHQFHFIKEGCIRMWFNKDGKDITFQFFFENQAVASIESLLSNQPSMFYVESIEASTIISVNKEIVNQINQLNSEFNKNFQNIIFQRFSNYAHLFLSRIRDTPKERYDDLVKNHPEIIKRVPTLYCFLPRNYCSFAKPYP